MDGGRTVKGILLPMCTPLMATLVKGHIFMDEPQPKAQPNGANPGGELSELSDGFLGAFGNRLIAKTHGHKQRSFRTFELSDFGAFGQLSDFQRSFGIILLSNFRTGAQAQYAERGRVLSHGHTVVSPCE